MGSNKTEPKSMLAGLNAGTDVPADVDAQLSALTSQPPSQPPTPQQPRERQAAAPKRAARHKIEVELVAGDPTATLSTRISETLKQRLTLAAIRGRFGKAPLKTEQQIVEHALTRVLDELDAAA